MDPYGGPALHTVNKEQADMIRKSDIPKLKDTMDMDDGERMTAYLEYVEELHAYKDTLRSKHRTGKTLSAHLTLVQHQIINATTRFGRHFATFMKQHGFTGDTAEGYKEVMKVILKEPAIGETAVPTFKKWEELANEAHERVHPDGTVLPEEVTDGVLQQVCKWEPPRAGAR